MNVRAVRPEDKPELMRIWEEVFRDPKPFTEWYFENRFFPEYGVCAELDGKIASVCHIMPCRIIVRGAYVPCGLLNGVATLPEHRKKGLMRACLAALHKSLKEKGIFIISNTPVDFDIYRPFSYAPVCGKISASEECPNAKMPDGILVRKLDECSDEIHGLYVRISQKYSGMLARSKKDTENRLADWSLEGARAIIYPSRGYAVFHKENENAVSNEILADAPGAYAPLWEALKSFGGRASAVFPPSSGIAGKTSDKSSALIIDPQAMLNLLNIPVDFALKITDMFNLENNGVFYNGGNCRNPSASMDITGFTEWIFGYKGFYDAADEIYDAQTCGALDRAVCALDCYNTDEY